MNSPHMRFSIVSYLVWACSVSICQAVTLEYAGSQANIGGTLFPGGGPANVQNYVVVPWRWDLASNTYATSNESPNRYYGTAGYALFATTFTYPDANFLGGEPALDPNGDDPLFPNIIDLPDWVSGSQILATRMAGGFGYSLIDDPVLSHGYRDYNWGDTQSPPSNPPHGQAPYVKMGFLDGGDIFGHNTTVEPTGRWGFQVGADAPAAFRVGVMTGGMDSENFVPGEVFLQQYDGVTPIGVPLGTGALSGALRDRFVDMHFFDIIGAQEGDQYVFGVMAGDNSFGNAGVAGFSFDVISDVPGGDADFNGDGDVDGRDFLVWQRGESPNPLSSGDLALWQDQYGTSPLVANVSVPEPSSLLLALCGLTCYRRIRW